MGLSAVTSRRILKHSDDPQQPEEVAKQMLHERQVKHAGGQEALNQALFEDGDYYDDYDENWDYDENEDDDEFNPDHDPRDDGSDHHHKAETVLKKMDSDKDGTISQEELMIWVFRAFHVVDVHDLAEDDFKAMDKNADEKLSWDEYITYFYEGSHSALDSKDKNVDNTDSYIYNREFHRVSSRFFTAAGLGGWSKLKPTTSLTLEQYKHFMNPFKVKTFVEKFKTLVMKQVDKNSDNAICREEFDQDWVSKPTDLASVMEEEKASKLSENYELYHFLRDESRLFHNCDMDKNGKLEKFEITFWLSPNLVQLARDEVELLFELCGHDKVVDGMKLEKAEVLKIAESWIDQTSIVRDSYFHHNEL